VQAAGAADPSRNGTTPPKRSNGSKPPCVDPLRKEPRFRAIERALKFPSPSAAQRQLSIAVDIPRLSQIEPFLLSCRFAEAARRPPGELQWWLQGDRAVARGIFKLRLTGR